MCCTWLCFSLYSGWSIAKWRAIGFWWHTHIFWSHPSCCSYGASFVECSCQRLFLGGLRFGHLRYSQGFSWSSRSSHCPWPGEVIAKLAVRFEMLYLSCYMVFFYWSREHDLVWSAEDLEGVMAYHSLVFVQILVHITALYRMSVFTHSQAWSWHRSNLFIWNYGDLSNDWMAMVLDVGGFSPVDTCAYFSVLFSTLWGSIYDSFAWHQLQ